MTAYMTLLTNENLSNRSMNLYQQGNVFSIDVGRCYNKSLYHANNGLLEPYDKCFRGGIRTLPRGNDSNWEISTVFEFDYFADAYRAASVVKACSQRPIILRDLKQEFFVVEDIRNKHYQYNRIRWNATRSISCIYIIDNITYILSDVFIA